jgi:predicted  nucleic acid-binding Zn-ribbon protein
MSISRQLYQLQEIDLEIESSERILEQISGKLGESEAVIKARDNLDRERQHLEELKQQQHAAEWEVDDLTAKLKDVEKKLYGGRITNSKELSNLQQEAKNLTANRTHLEDKILETMEQIEQTTDQVAGSTTALKALEDKWRQQQQQLSGEAGQIKGALADLRQRRQSLLGSIDPQVLEVYNELKQNKGAAVARVEQGICRGCQISLSAAELQWVRGGGMVRCSSCGRILFLA